MEWNRKLKEARKNAKITQADLADRIGVHRSTVANYELGRRKPSLTELKAIAKILHVDVNFILEGSEVNSQDELLVRANDVFADVNISTEDKDAIFRDLMEIYMKGKSVSASNQSSRRNNP